mgnify:CR=1 FL=1
MTAAGATFWLVLLVAAMVGILLLRRWLASHPFGLPPLDVSPDDPLMKEAEARARRALPTFLELVPHHPGSCYVKFAFESDSGAVEHLWARVEGAEADGFAVRVETPPALHDGPFEPERTIPRSAVEDWQVELEDGRIRGGYTLHAMFAIHRRDLGDVPKRFAEHEARYVDC